MRNGMFVLAAGFAAVVLCACTPPSTSTSPPQPVTVTKEVTAGVTLQVEIPQRRLSAETTSVATITLSNSADESRTVFDVKGVRVTDPNGAVVSDALAGVIYQSVQVILPPHEARIVRREFVVPPAGAYRLEAFLWEPGPALSVPFTSEQP